MLSVGCTGLGVIRDGKIGILADNSVHVVMGAALVWKGKGK